MALPGHIESIVSHWFFLVVMSPSEYHYYKVGVWASSLLRFFRHDSMSIQVSTTTMREGGDGEDGRMTPVERKRETVEIQSHLISGGSSCMCFGLLDKY